GLELVLTLELLAQDMTFRQRGQKLSCGAEGDGNALFFFKIEAADSELRIQLGDHACAAAGHEEAFAFVVRQPAFDFFSALDGIALRVAELRERERSRKRLMRAERLLEGLFDLRAKRRRMLRQTPDFLQDLEPLRPKLLVFECVGQESEERVGLGALFGFAEGLRGGEEWIDIREVAVELGHPERLDLIK